MIDNKFELLDYVRLPIFVLEPGPDKDPVYAAFNKTALAATGFKLGDVLGRNALQLYGGRLGRIRYLRHRETLESGVPNVHEFTLRLKGELITIRTRLEPVLDEYGATRLIVGTSEDISHQKNLQESMVESEAIVGDIEDFINLAAHDLRAPMRNVQQLTVLLREGFQDLGDGKLELIDMLDSVTVKSMDLISEVLSHAVAIRSLNEKVEFDFSVLCRDILSVLDPEETCDTKIEGQWLLADKTAVQIVLRNLIDNALKYAKSDHLKISVTATAVDDDNLQFIVCDNGGGFSDAAMKLLRGGKPQAASGFGLLGVRRIVRARGGTLDFQNNTVTGGGSKITITLPGQPIDVP